MSRRARTAVRTVVTSSRSVDGPVTPWEYESRWTGELGCRGKGAGSGSAVGGRRHERGNGEEERERGHRHTRLEHLVAPQRKEGLGPSAREDDGPRRRSDRSELGRLLRRINEYLFAGPGGKKRLRRDPAEPRRFLAAGSTASLTACPLASPRAPRRLDDGAGCRETSDLRAPRGAIPPDRSPVARPGIPSLVSRFRSAP
jgi:hypothetical protein